MSLADTRMAQRVGVGSQRSETEMENGKWQMINGKLLVIGHFSSFRTLFEALNQHSCPDSLYLSPRCVRVNALLHTKRQRQSSLSCLS